MKIEIEVSHSTHKHTHTRAHKAVAWCNQNERTRPKTIVLGRRTRRMRVVASKLSAAGRKFKVSLSNSRRM